MTLRVVGAGLGRTGTHSLKVALERLLGAPCYHMVELFQHRDHIPGWHAATRGESVSWSSMMQGYSSAVDWPASAFWRELSDAFPDAIILLSLRDSKSWWKSADETIFQTFRRGHDPADPWFAMVTELLSTRFTPGFLEPSAAIEAYEKHVDEVRRTAPKSRLLEWHARDGWGPLCERLGVPVPSEPFPHVNTTDEFRARARLD